MSSAAVTVVLLVAVAAYLFRPLPALPKVRLFTTVAPFSAASLLAESRGWFRDAGVDVTVEERPSGRNALAELTDGKGDFATAAETPIMFALLKATPIKVIATLGISFDNTTLVGRKDRGITSSDDLPGHRVGYAPGTNSQYFLDTFLEYRGHAAGSVERIPLKPEEMLQSLVDGRVDVIATWSPLNHQALAKLGDNGQELRIGSIYRWSWNLVARNEELANGPLAPLIITALMRATSEISHDPLGCARELSTRIGMPADKLMQVWKQTSFDVTLDQSLLLNLEQQARWAMASGMTDQKEVPNFLVGINSQALRSIDADIVTLIDGKGRP
ncbi:MAG TPA: NrtA/SsuA/CpmA family ABC transporter substrate-binding protein [Planctomycetota bacterium]|nr:NrtA/SsuA/CpmA family ABC transporter substrate-binding protein [Planctomycetota bacterium]